MKEIPHLAGCPTLFPACGQGGREVRKEESWRKFC